jgi:hypothetical protein
MISSSPAIAQASWQFCWNSWLDSLRALARHLETQGPLVFARIEFLDVDTLFSILPSIERFGVPISAVKQNGEECAGFGPRFACAGCWDVPGVQGVWPCKAALAQSVGPRSGCAGCWDKVASVEGASSLSNQLPSGCCSLSNTLSSCCCSLFESIAFLLSPPVIVALLCRSCMTYSSEHGLKEQHELYELCGQYNLLIGDTWANYEL